MQKDTKPLNLSSLQKEGEFAEKEKLIKPKARKHTEDKVIPRK